MRSLGILALVVAVATTAIGQQLPFRATGDFYVTDFSNDAVYRFQDKNGDGDVQDVGEQIVFYSDASPGPDLATPTGMTVDPRDGSVWISDVNLDLVIRLQDRNGDGDANDAGEWSIFYDNTGDITLGSANDLAIDANGVVYLAVAGVSAQPKDHIVRLEDKNNDGDANDPTEATEYLDSTNLSGFTLALPFDAILYQGDVWVVDATMSPDSILRLRDLNNDGDANDANEVVRYASPKTGGGAVVYDLLFDPTGVLYANDTNGNINRYVDRNSDGDALDPGEHSLFFDSANNASNISLRVSFTFTGDSNGNLFACNRSNDVTYKLTDLNSDGDANDAGEAVVYADNNGPPPLPNPLAGARDCVFGPAGVIMPGIVSPRIGRTPDFLLDDTVGGSRAYVAAISLGNTGIPLASPDTRALPLSAEPLFFASVLGLLPLQQNFTGVFPPSGQAVAKLTIPSASALVNVVAHMAFVTIDATSPSGLRTVSQPFSFTILP